MAPGVRSLTAAVSLTGALLLTPLPLAVAVGDPTPTASTSPSGPAGPSPSASASGVSPSQVADGNQHLAGSRAGVGRIRPGRVDTQYPAVSDFSDETVPALQDTSPQAPARIPAPEPSQPAPPPTPAPRDPPARTHPRHHQTPQALTTGDSDLRFHVMSLGAGLALTGLGLGFLALRLRRP
ncbi:hypothetical protein [Streptomyces sp. NBC_00083]|uniref:hypothetical protein n=1 Tax=Streptomyces sp. NBC_00083 TaxID=2975647 RepID=UPI002256BAB6|nr:hypothetical protein [Streptomyces sp. NBC_00083]MCX5388315.1 hypothetical protein [Streptomyces sp. NBC_00083]